MENKFKNKFYTPSVMNVSKFLYTFNFTDYLKKFFENNDSLVSAVYNFSFCSTHTGYEGEMKFTKTPTKQTLKIVRYDKVQCDELNIPAVDSSDKIIDFSRVYENTKNGEVVGSGNIPYWQKSFMAYLNVMFQKQIEEEFDILFQKLLQCRYRMSPEQIKEYRNEFSITTKNEGYTKGVSGWCLPMNTLIKKEAVRNCNGERVYVPYIDVCTEFTITRNLSKKNEEN